MPVLDDAIFYVYDKLVTITMLIYIPNFIISKNIQVEDSKTTTNNHILFAGTAIFDAVWDQISPTLSSAVEHVVNEALQNVSVSEIIPLNREWETWI